MSGFFVVGEKKERPGVYKRYENAGGVEAAGARSGVGCALVTGNWGALNTPALSAQVPDTMLSQHLWPEAWRSALWYVLERAEHRQQLP